MHDVIVIGGGAAGLSATVFLLGKECDVLLIAEVLGGKAGARQYLAEEPAEEYIAGEEVTSMFARRVSTHVDHLIRDSVTAVTRNRHVFSVTTERNGTHEAAAVVLATGVTPVLLDAPGAERFAGYGIGYSVTTHAHLTAGKRVAVVGNTQRALRGAHELAQSAENVSLIVPDPSIMQSALGLALPYRYNVDVYEGAQVVAVEGTTAVERLVIAQAGQQLTLPVVAVFVDLGLRPNTHMVRRLAALDGDDFVRVDAQLATSVSGLFAAGDATTTPSENVLIGMGDGARAARSAYDYVLAHPSLRARGH